MFASNLESDPILGPVMQAGLDALKSDGRAGKLFIFHTAMPTREAPGKLKPRDQQRLLGTDKEKVALDDIFSCGYDQNWFRILISEQGIRK